jgi:hypothetical protein
MSKTGRTYVALAGAALALVIAGWFDNAVLRDALRYADATFNPIGVTGLFAFGSVLVAGSALVVAVLAWRTASVAVGLAYGVVGGFFVALPWLVWNLAAQVNGTPALLPEPLAYVLGRIYIWTSDGSLNAVGTIGAAMLIAGVASLVRSSRRRGVAASGRGFVVERTSQTGP